MVLYDLHCEKLLYTNKIFDHLFKIHFRLFQDVMSTITINEKPVSTHTLTEILFEDSGVLLGPGGPVKRKEVYIPILSFHL